MAWQTQLVTAAVLSSGAWAQVSDPPASKEGPRWPVVYEQSFDDASAAADFVCSDPEAWRLDRGSLWQFAASDYEPTHRSPRNIALLDTARLGSFVLEADVMQTGREYGHRDVCFVFGFQNPEHYCYAHLSTTADQNAHNVFVVDDAPRTPITDARNEGVDWGWNTWKKLRVEFDTEERHVRVLLDGEEVMSSDRVPFGNGYVGFGSFDDEVRFDNIRIWSNSIGTDSSGAYSPLGSETGGGEARFEQREGRVAVFFGDEPFTEYVYADTPKPYLAPVRGPGGVRLTRAYPMEDVPGESQDHPHHTGVWWAHGDIDGVDLWHGGARLVLLEEPTISGDTLAAKFSLENDEEPTGVVVEQTIRVVEFLNGDRAIDFGVALTPPPGGTLVLGDTKEGSMAIRTHPALRLKTASAKDATPATGRARNSKGTEGKAVWGKRAAWIDFSGTVDGAPVGIAIFDHPGNPRFPTWWHAREYGLIAANPFGTSAFEGGDANQGDMTVPAGASVSFSYRLLFHRFGTDAARVTDAYRAWIDPV